MYNKPLRDIELCSLCPLYNVCESYTEPVLKMCLWSQCSGEGNNKSKRQKTFVA